MTDSFDPYSAWLGIAPDERPVNHYRLLGIPCFEADPELIEAAADRRMFEIRQYQTGPRGRYSQQLLNELAVAKLCLLDPRAKAAYDQMLQGPAAAGRQHERPGPAASRSAPPAVEEPWPRPPALAADSALHEPHDVPYYLRPTFPLMALAAVAAVALAIWYVGRNINARAGVDRPAPPANGLPAAPLPESTRDPAAEPAIESDDAVVVEQGADGEIHLSAPSATLHGESLRRDVVEMEEVIAGWSATGERISWTFEVGRLPRNGVFRVKVTYAAQPDAAGSRFLLAIDDAPPKECETRGSDGLVTDEYFLPLLKKGRHRLTLRLGQQRGSGLAAVKHISLSLP